MRMRPSADHRGRGGAESERRGDAHADEHGLGKLALDGGITRLDSLTALPTAATISINSGGIFRLNTSDGVTSPATPVLGSAISVPNSLSNAVTFNGGTLQTTAAAGTTRTISGTVTLAAGTTSKIVPTGFGGNETLRNFLRFFGKVTGDGTLRIEAPNHGYPGTSGTNNNRPGVIFQNTSTDLSGTAVISLGDNIGVTSQAVVNGAGLNVNTGDCFGSAKLLVAGTLNFNSTPLGATATIVASDALTGSNSSILYGNAVEFQSDGRINVQRQGSVNTNNKISFGGLTVTGNRTVQFFSEGGRYTVGFGGGGATSTLAGNATLQTFEADGTFSTGNVAFDGPIVETGEPRSLSS